MVIQDVFTLFVTDKMSECRDFYARFFGFRVDVDSPIYLQMSTAGAGESRFSLAFMPTGHPFGVVGHLPVMSGGLMVTVRVDDSAAVYADVVAADGPIVHALRTEEWGQRRFTMMDPAGTFVDVVQDDGIDVAPGYYEQFESEAAISDTPADAGGPDLPVRERDVAVRVMGAADREGVRSLALINRMFAPEEMGGFDEMLSGYLNGSAPDHHWVVAESSGEVVGAGYYAGEPFGDRVWNLYFLAVHPDLHRQGIGGAVVDHVAEHLRTLGDAAARVLVVETSSTDAYHQARSFYVTHGFDEEARIREFYGPGDDKVVFWRRTA